jgi:hypothetical protein
MYKLDKTISSIKTHKDLEKDKVFAPNVSLGERLHQAWYLTAMAYGIDPQNPPRMKKELTAIRKKEING